MDPRARDFVAAGSRVATTPARSASVGSLLRVLRLLEIVRDQPAEAREVAAAQLRPAHQRIDDGIGRHAILQQLEMDVRAGRPAGAADEADQLPALDPDPFL